ncbi:MAG: glycosyltransferase [Acidobacteriota bacterium]|nr:glycosyltransferase [Acidobacteriota bacterium]
MQAFSFWKGDDFCLLEYLSLLSTSVNTTYPQFLLFYDETDCPDTVWWHRVDDIPTVRKQAASGLLADYRRRYLADKLIEDPRILADLFRYAHLYHHGGVWLDLDMIQVKDLRLLTEGRSFTAGWECENYVNIAVLGLQKEHPIAGRLLKSLADVLQDDRPAFNAIGPKLMTNVVMETGHLYEVLPIETFYPIHYKETDRLLFGHYTLSPDTWGIHAWAYLTRHHFQETAVDVLMETSSTFFALARCTLQAACAERIAREQAGFRPAPTAPLTEDFMPIRPVSNKVSLP